VPRTQSSRPTINGRRKAVDVGHIASRTVADATRIALPTLLEQSSERLLPRDFAGVAQRFSRRMAHGDPLGGVNRDFYRMVVGRAVFTALARIARRREK
jgi:hypothetical protein